MKISIREEEYYPVLIPYICAVKPIEGRGTYEIDDKIYKKWMRAFEDYHNTQKEIKKMQKKEERKHRRSICGFKLGEKK